MSFSEYALGLGLNDFGTYFIRKLPTRVIVFSHLSGHTLMKSNHTFDERPDIEDFRRRRSGCSV